jgi:hypothetical protein
MTLAGRKGRAALCFPRAEGDGDGDGSAWFQGYFVCSRSRVQLGLLGEQQPVDDWLVGSLAHGCSWRMCWL